MNGCVHTHFMCACTHTFALASNSLNIPACTPPNFCSGVCGACCWWLMFSRRAPRRGRRCRGRVGRHALDYEPRLVPRRRRRCQGVKSAHVDADASRDDVVDAESGRGAALDRPPKQLDLMSNVNGAVMVDCRDKSDVPATGRLVVDRDDVVRLS